MEVPIERTRYIDRLLASFIFFTRLPFWRLAQPPKECYSHVVEHWPLVGWLTGGVMALVLYFGSWLLPWPVVVILAIVARMLITGALHEDGLADFFDGFGGGGTDRERILDIMKDSHIGTFGVVSLIFYFLLLFFTLFSMTPEMAALAVLAVDPYAKMVSSQLIVMMPYARTAESAKNHTVYRRPTTAASVGLAVQGVLPLVIFLYLMRSQVEWSTVVFSPCIVMYFLYLLIWRRIRGYTGDCCGAVCLLTELTTLLSVLVCVAS
ncbi:MAG: adenosylcobinamide-GDP ribazoletransferase [Prevotella sp.]|nr:adenosylcobinamide-GDP ribazoletransferase [Prevotella sp.]